MSTGETVELSVIVPARNEEASLGACLESLVAQSELGFELGRDWELIVVDDASTDSTRRIAESIEGVTVMAAPLLDVTAQTGFTGKTNACWAGAQAAQGRVLVFTDADTIHEPGGLSRARHEREKYEVGLLSYSPKQLTSGPLQRMLMPLVFAELAIGFPMKRVNDPADRTAAANGQFIMVDAQNYFDLGGHRAIGREVLEDVALASLFKRAKRGLRFRYAPDALATRMYRSDSGDAGGLDQEPGTALWGNAYDPAGDAADAGFPADRAGAVSLRLQIPVSDDALAAGAAVGHCVAAGHCGGFMHGLRSRTFRRSRLRGVGFLGTCRCWCSCCRGFAARFR